MASHYLWILDNGHGGIIDGVYQTKGKRSPKFEDGTVLYEGEFNRAIVQRLVAMCNEAGIDCLNLVDSEEDTPLRRRTDQANEIHGEDPRGVYVSVHANAHTPGNELRFNSAHGIETFFFQKGERKSTSGQTLAEIFQRHLIDQTGLRDRGAKGGNLHVLRETNMPAVLTENGFMTNREEARALLDEDFRDQVARAHFDAIREIEDARPV